MAKIKICLDAGHVGKYNRSPVVKEYYESDMNWKLHLLLKKYLEEYGFEVILTRKTQDENLNVISRGNKAKGCDLFLSIHSNACDTESVDYPVVIVPINGKGDAIGNKLAECIAKVMGTRQKGRIWERKSGNLDWYGVIRGAVAVGVPGLILEHSFHTNTRATKWLLDNGNLDALARAEAEVIAEHYGMGKSAEKPAEKPVEAKKTVEQIAKEVISGKWDSGAERKRLLTAAGYDATAVQAKVNELLGVGTKKKKSVTEIAQEVIRGDWGSGEERKKKLTEAGYNATTVQRKVNELLKK